MVDLEGRSKRTSISWMNSPVLKYWSISECGTCCSDAGLFALLRALTGSASALELFCALCHFVSPQ